MGKFTPQIATRPSKESIRNDRRHSPDKDDQRTRSQKDRDRLLYSGSLRRLAGVTQVASATEVDMFHNRLTHTLKVAQVGRRIAEKLFKEHGELAEELGGIDPDVVESAALAHDLGHPPFGHIAETELDKCLKDKEAGDGYEGNAQSFRVITCLAFCKSKFPGLNLTRATLNATLKYPWLREAAGDHNKKFGAYQTERLDFDYARTGMIAPAQRSPEAEIMDLADDITYSVHDVEDFYQSGLIPLDRLAKDIDEREKFFENTETRWKQKKRPEFAQFGDYKAAFNRLADLLPLKGPYTGSANQRRAIKPVISQLIRNYVYGISIHRPKKPGAATITIRQDLRLEMTMLKELTWNYVILSPALATQQFGQKKIIRDLFKVYSNAIAGNDRNIIPPWFKLDDDLPTKPAEIARAAADVISTLTDRQAHLQFLRLNGIAPGSIRDWI